MDQKLLCLTILCLQFMPALSTSVTELYLGDSRCSMKTYEANENQFYEIVWGGELLPRNCKIGFIGTNKDDIFDQYKLCAEVLTYKVKDCSFEMIYYEQKQYSKQITRTYHCDILPEKYCSRPDKDFDVEIKNAHVSSSAVRILISAIKTYDFILRRSVFNGGGKPEYTEKNHRPSTSNSLPSLFKIDFSGVKRSNLSEEDKSSLVGAIVGGILAGAVILAVIIVGIVFLKIRKRRKPVLIPDPDRETRV